MFLGLGSKWAEFGYPNPKNMGKPYSVYMDCPIGFLLMDLDGIRYVDRPETCPNSFSF